MVQELPKPSSKTVLSNPAVSAVFNKPHTHNDRRLQIFTTDAYSTAYKFPLVDAKVQEQADGSFTVTVPLDGTVYDLATGKVLKWCPGGNALQSVLQSMKKDSPAIDLPVYNTIVTPEGKIMVDYQNVLGA